MSALSATPLTPAGAASTVPAAPAAHTYTAGAQQPALAVIDAAIMQAVAAGDSARRDALMARRAAIAIAEILGALTDAATPTDVALSPTPGRGRTPARGGVWHTCAHCHEAGTTVCGALWRVSLKPGRGDLYYLHGHCLDPYKVARGLRSVEGRLPRADTRARWARRARRFTPTAPAARIADRSIAP